MCDTLILIFFLIDWARIQGLQIGPCVCVCDRICVCAYDFERKIINLENIKLILFFILFLFFKIGSWIGPPIRGFRLGLEVAGWGPQGLTGQVWGLKKKIRLVNEVSSGFGGWVAGQVQA